MKLFDRSVDLAQFNENSSLYSIARAWISNKTQQEERSPSPDMTQQSQEEVGLFSIGEGCNGVYWLAAFGPAFGW